MFNNKSELWGSKPPTTMAYGSGFKCPDKYYYYDGIIPFLGVVFIGLDSLGFRT